MAASEPAFVGAQADLLRARTDARGVLAASVSMGSARAHWSPCAAMILTAAARRFGWQRSGESYVSASRRARQRTATGVTEARGALREPCARAAPRTRVRAEKKCSCEMQGSCARASWRAGTAARAARPAHGIARARLELPTRRGSRGPPLRALACRSRRPCSCIQTSTAAGLRRRARWRTSAVGPRAARWPRRARVSLRARARPVRRPPRRWRPATARSCRSRGMSDEHRRWRASAPRSCGSSRCAS